MTVEKDLHQSQNPGPEASLVCPRILPVQNNSCVKLTLKYLPKSNENTRSGTNACLTTTTTLIRFQNIKPRKSTAQMANMVTPYVTFPAMAAISRSVYLLGSVDLDT